MPSPSAALAMVLAVHAAACPFAGADCPLDGIDVGATYQNRESTPDRLEGVNDGDVSFAVGESFGPAGREPARNTADGSVRRPSAPGSDLSHPASSTEPSSCSACITTSTLSAITSRETSGEVHPHDPWRCRPETETLELADSRRPKNTS